MSRHEDLFQRLQNVNAILNLIGQTEDVHLAFKIWPPSDGDAQNMLSKALCGFANSDGGVIAIELGRRGRDFATSEEPSGAFSSAPHSHRLHWPSEDRSEYK